MDFRVLQWLIGICDSIIYKIKVNLSGQNQYFSKFNQVAGLQVRDSAFKTMFILF